MHHLNIADAALLAAHLMHVQMREDVQICANMKICAQMCNYVRTCKDVQTCKDEQMCKYVQTCNNVDADRVQKLLNSSCLTTWRRI